MSGKKSPLARVSDGELVEMGAEPLSKNAVMAQIEMNRRFKDATKLWSVLIFVATLVLLGATVAIVYLTTVLVNRANP